MHVDQKQSLAEKHKEWAISTYTSYLTQGKHPDAMIIIIEPNVPLAKWLPETMFKATPNFYTSHNQDGITIVVVSRKAFNILMEEMELDNHLHIDRSRDGIVVITMSRENIIPGEYSID